VVVAAAVKQAQEVPVAAVLVVPHLATAVKTLVVVAAVAKSTSLAVLVVPV